MPTQELNKLALTVGESLASRGMMLATAESCTGGWVAQTITSVAGSSAWFERGFVTYSNVSKQELLGVPHDLILAHGAVSRQVAECMATGAVQHSRAQVALAITGIAGPDGGSEFKPVGTVWLAWAVGYDAEDLNVVAEKCQFDGDRQEVRLQAVMRSLEGLISLLQQA